jgi:hypothetical protein
MNRDRAVAGSSFLSAEGGSFGGVFWAIELSSWADADVVKPSVRLKENSRTRRTTIINSTIVETFAERENPVITCPLKQKKYPHNPSRTVSANFAPQFRSVNFWCISCFKSDEMCGMARFAVQIVLQTQVAGSIR